jgi:4-hydroxy-tetrahydrodipicolinate synthase
MIHELPSGSWPVLFTPFTSSKEVDGDGLDASLDFYLETGQAGIFANALSGEVFSLTKEECLQIATRLVRRSAGRLPVVSSGNFGATLDQQAESMKAISHTGVSAVVILLSALPEPTDLAEQVLELAEKVDCPLGIYECPVPEHRLLDADGVRRIAATGKFSFMKETSRTVGTYTEKMKAAEGTPLKVFQANLRCTPGSLENGSPGVCGIFSNFCPEWTARLCEIGATPSPERDSLMRALVAFHDVATRTGYPSSGKYLLEKRGLPIAPISRSHHTHEFSEQDQAFLDKFLEGMNFQTPSISEERLASLLEEIGAPPLVD